MASREAVSEEVVPGERVGNRRRGIRWAATIGSWLRPRRRWCRGTRLVVAGTAAWLGFVVGHRLFSGRASWWLFDLVPPVLLLVPLVPLLAVAPLARPVRWRIMAVLVVAGLMSVPPSGVNLATLAYSPPPPPPGAVTVVAWNTEFWDQNWRTGDGGGYDAGFHPYLRQLDADVYLLSEYLYADAPDGDLSQWTADMATRIDDLPRLRREFPGYHVAISGEHLTLSRYPIVAQRGLDIRPWLPDPYRDIPPELRDFPEYHAVETLRTDIRLPDGVVSFYNGHIPQPRLDWRLHRDESRAANRHYEARRDASYGALRDDVERNPNPVVLAGDMNTSPAMGIHRLLPEDLVDHTRALPSVYPATWRAGGTELWRLDWLFTTEEVRVHSYELPSAEDLSDHRPQRFVLSVSG